MAKLPALVDALAAADYRSRATIDQIARVVREAGYIPTTKRGSGAADMTVREAANLLIGSFVESPAQAAKAVGLYRRLHGQHMQGSDDSAGLFKEISDAETFGEALEVLIGGVPRLVASFEEYIEIAYSESYTAEQMKIWKASALKIGIISLEIEVHRPSPYAEIRITSSNGGEPRRVHHVWRYMVTVAMMDSGELKGHFDSDRRICETVGLTTIQNLHKAIVGEE